MTSILETKIFVIYTQPSALCEVYDLYFEKSDMISKVNSFVTNVNILCCHFMSANFVYTTQLVILYHL